MTNANGLYVALVLGAVFAGGVATGIAVDRYRAENNQENNQSETKLILTSRVPTELESLALTRDQRRQIQSVFDRNGPRADSAMRDVIAHLRQVTTAVDSEVRGILTPEQRVNFNRNREARSSMLIRRNGNRADTVRNP